MHNLDVQVALVLMFLSIAWLVTAIGLECLKEYKNWRSEKDSH